MRPAIKTKMEVHDALGGAVADSLKIVGLEFGGPDAEQFAAALRSSYEQERVDLAEKVGAFLAARTARGLEPAHVLGHVVGAVQNYFGGEGSSKRLASLLQGLCTGYVGALPDRLSVKPAELLGEREIAVDRNRHAVCDRETARMRAALDDGEFFLVYQPIFRLADNCIIGAEALLRWAHPTLGTLLPHQFIGLAERSGLIVPLTAFVIEKACRHVRVWCDNSAGSQPFVSVNVSVNNICDPGFRSMVESALFNAGLPAYALHLEVAEAGSLGEDEASVAKLQELSAVGVNIAVDDFGTGSSSLAYLPDLPVDMVKLAGRLIENLGGNINDRLADEQVTRAVIDLAYKLGLTVTAKKVETPSQVGRLRDFGCQAAQGWHFAKALPVDFFIESVT